MSITKAHSDYVEQVDKCLVGQQCIERKYPKDAELKATKILAEIGIDPSFVAGAIRAQRSGMNSSDDIPSADGHVLFCSVWVC